MDKFRTRSKLLLHDIGLYSALQMRLQLCCWIEQGSRLMSPSRKIKSHRVATKLRCRGCYEDR
jgi:hypothetical protein